MAKNFWSRLKKPIMAMAPMANVTDAAFRRMFAECGKPDVFWTEFVSVEGLLSKGKENLLVDLWFSEGEHPIVAQIFGGKPEQFEEVGALIRKLGFDGIDINMGCPDSGVEKSGGGAALIKDPQRAKEIIRAAMRGAKDLPVSVKTRIGYNAETIDSWITAILEEHPAALTVHLRTRKEMSDVPAHWDRAPKIAELRNRISPQTILLGNGDINSIDEAKERVKESGMDGAMIGRGMFGNPWFFSGRIPDIGEKLERMIQHTELFEKLYRSNVSKKDGKIKNFEVMKKHYKAYAAGFDGARELRIALMDAKGSGDVKKITQAFLKKI
jgi:nifR3 family TIM-barrel protein